MSMQVIFPFNSANTGSI